jgi:hypothetical protein
MLFGLASGRSRSKFRCRTGTERFWQTALQRIVRARAVLARGASSAMRCGRCCIVGRATVEHGVDGRRAPAGSRQALRRTLRWTML